MIVKSENVLVAHPLKIKPKFGCKPKLSYISKVKFCSSIKFPKTLS